jgi:hypothetical protein
VQVLRPDAEVAFQLIEAAVDVDRGYSGSFSLTLINQDDTAGPLEPFFRRLPGDGRIDAVDTILTAEERCRPRGPPESVIQHSNRGFFRLRQVRRLGYR